MAKKRKGRRSLIRLVGPDDPIFKEGPTFYTRKSDRISTPPKKTGRAILESPAGPDDPIYKEGFTVYTPRSHRGSFTSKPRPKAPPKKDANE